VSLGSAEQAAHWARSALAAKNRLTTDDARLVQVAFEFRLSAFEVDAAEAQAKTDPGSSLAPGVASSAPGPSVHSSPAQKPSRPDLQPVSRRSGRVGAGRIDKSVLTLAEVRRYRDKAHVQFVASRPCVVCGRKPADPHHLRFAQARALGRKVSDEFTVPVCRLHHRELHRSRNERAWWKKLGLDPIKIARHLWDRTRSSRSIEVPAAHRSPRSPVSVSDAGTPNTRMDAQVGKPSRGRIRSASTSRASWP
jgi:hypothetical protein